MTPDEIRGHEHISSVGMGASLDVDPVRKRLEVIQDARKSIGIQYTTWSADCGRIAEFGDLVSSL